MTYRVVITARPVTTSRSIPRPIAVRIGEELASLAGETDPKKHLRKLKRPDNPAFYSLRVGDYRVVLQIHNNRLVILVIEIGPRDSIYRKF